MRENLSPSLPMGPLSVGNVVSAGLRLYRDYFKLYFGVAIRASLWAVLPFLFLIPIPLLLIYGQANLSNLWLIIPIWLLLFFYGFAKYMANSALIARLAFGQLVERPESIQDARRHVDPKIWIFLRTNLLVFLITFGVVLGFYVVSLLIGGIGGAIAYSFGENIAAIGIIVVIGVIAFAVALSALFRFFTRLCMVEVPLAIEENLKATQTIGRSWNLTKGHVGRIFGILTIAFLIYLPFYIIVQIAASIIQASLIRIIPTDPTSPSFQLLLFIVSYILGLVSGTVVLPFWQAIKAVMYYDLRSRREGLDLQQRDSMWQ